VWLGSACVRVRVCVADLCAVAGVRISCASTAPCSSRPHSTVPRSNREGRTEQGGSPRVRKDGHTRRKHAPPAPPPACTGHCERCLRRCACSALRESLSQQCGQWQTQTERHAGQADRQNRLHAPPPQQRHPHRTATDCNNNSKNLGQKSSEPAQSTLGTRTGKMNQRTLAGRTGG
jgi:hypothetical protein